MNNSWSMPSLVLICQNFVLYPLVLTSPYRALVSICQNLAVYQDFNFEVSEFLW